MAKLLARTAHAAAYQIHSPKGGIVGETERKARLQQSVLKEWVPNIAFCDEVTEALPLERSDFNGDSGASAAVTAALLTALSDETRRGRSLFIGTTNCPWRMGAAMRSRFTVIPVLHPLREDFPEIIHSIAQSISTGTTFDTADPRVLEAAGIFYGKGSTARHIRAALSQVILTQGNLTAEGILAAARDVPTTNDLASTIYTDLWAVKVTSSRSFLPWASDPARYPFPPHLQGIIDPSTGVTDETELNRRIEEMKTHVNI